MQGARWETQVDHARTMVRNSRPDDGGGGESRANDILLSHTHTLAHRPTSDGEKGPNYCFPYQFDINKIRVSSSTCDCPPCSSVHFTPPPPLLSCAGSGWYIEFILARELS